MSAQWVLGLGVFVFIAVYALCDLNKLYALRYGADTGAFERTIPNAWRHGSTFNGYEHQPHLAVHDSWSLLAPVPIMAAFPRAETLIALQLLADIAKGHLIRSAVS